MGVMDAFAKEDRVEVKFSSFYELVKQAAQLETVMNGVNCDVPHKYIREMQSGKKEQETDAEKCIMPGIVIGIDLAGGERPELAEAPEEENQEEQPEREEDQEEQQEPEAAQEFEEDKDNEHV